MNPDRWREVSRIYGAVLTKPESDRPTALASLCRDDAELRREVESLLQSGQDAALLDRAATESPSTLGLLEGGAVGSQIGVFKIESLLGVGGMGEVYRARDTKLNRDVAIKILPPAFASDPDRLARFKREAQVLASLNHPNIGGIYGFEDQERVHALVLELVEGPTLADKLAPGSGLRSQGPARSAQGLAINEVLAIARQIADALEAAHEQGIIHRDLKPANIKVRDDGTVKVLDFGLAKIAETTQGSGLKAQGELTQSPTITTPAMTTAGMILGTAAYMSPEQAKGKPADKRSDIWSFGVVLFEMLAGRRPFDGEDMADVLGAVVRLEPQWALLPSGLPQPLRALLEGCLVKDRRKRVGGISTALFVLERSTTLVGSPASPAIPPPSRMRRALPFAAAMALTAVIVGTAVSFLTGRDTRPQPRVSRLTITPANDAPFKITGEDLAITPDGTRIVYVADRGSQLFSRSLDALEPVRIHVGERLNSPFVSPDGRWVGFTDSTNTLSKVPSGGGPAIPITSIDAFPRGVAWAADGTIIFATNTGAVGLQQINDRGGPITEITRPDRSVGEADHLWPVLLPDERHVLFTITAVAGGLAAAQVAAFDRQTGTHRVLLHGGSHARYVGSAIEGRGHLVYLSAGALLAVPFDLATLQTYGTPVPVVSDLVSTPLGGADLAVSREGTMAYFRGHALDGGAGLRSLVWVNRDGAETPLAAPLRGYLYPRISPDGKRLALGVADQAFDIWLYDLDAAGTGLSRATSDAGVDSYPVWTVDGKHLVFNSERSGFRNLFWQPSDSIGAVTRLTEGAHRQAATATTADQVIFTEAVGPGHEEVKAAAVDGSGRIRTLIGGPGIARNGIVSPDGQWLAYESNASGRQEIWLRPFPNVEASVVQISTGGGKQPVWSRKGDELIYVSPSGDLMAIPVDKSRTWMSRAARVVAKGEILDTNDLGRVYDVAADGRFLMIKQAAPSPSATPSSLVVAQNWQEELQRLVPWQGGPR